MHVPYVLDDDDVLFVSDIPVTMEMVVQRHHQNRGPTPFDPCIQIQPIEPLLENNYSCDSYMDEVAPLRIQNNEHISE